MHYGNSPCLQCNHPTFSEITCMQCSSARNLSVVNCHLRVDIFSCQPSDLRVVSWRLSVDECELILASLLIVLCEWIKVTFNCKLILKSWHWQVDIIASWCWSGRDVGEFQSWFSWVNICELIKASLELSINICELTLASVNLSVDLYKFVLASLS